MNLDFTPEELAFRDDVRAFIAENYPKDGVERGARDLTKEEFLAWHKVLHTKGWVAPGHELEIRSTHGRSNGEACLLGRPRRSTNQGEGPLRCLSNSCSLGQTGCGLNHGQQNAQNRNHVESDHDCRKAQNRLH